MRYRACSYHRKTGVRRISLPTSAISHDLWRTGRWLAVQTESSTSGHERQRVKQPARCGATHSSGFQRTSQFTYSYTHSKSIYRCGHIRPEESRGRRQWRRCDSTSLVYIYVKNETEKKKVENWNSIRHSWSYKL